MRKLHMELYIRQGTARGLTKSALRPFDLSGMTLRVEIPLGLVPSPDDVAPAELRFDLGDGGAEVAEAIVPLDLKDPDGRLTDIDAELVQLALCDCLSKNRDKIGFVFAEVAPGAAQAGAWMYTPHLDWASLSTGDGRNYLAVFGALTKPTPAMVPGKIDPDLIAGVGAAYFACSRRIYASNILVPWLTGNFRSKGTFTPDGNFARLARPVRLPKINTVVGKLTPAIQTMRVGPNVGGLGITLESHTPVNQSVTIIVRMTLKMKMFVDASGNVGLKPDPKPKIKHEVVGKGILGSIIAAIAKLVIAATGTNIEKIATSLAHKFQAINVPAAQPVAWTGTRKFVTSTAKSEDCLWFSDARPA